MAAAGAAETMAKNGTDGKVIMLEKMPRPGRKIMITGKGRCNFTNVKPWNEFNGHIHPKPNFLKPSFYNLTSEKMVDYLQEHGMEVVIERGDRAFPASHLASDVVDALVRAAEDAGAKIHCGKEVRDISRQARNDDDCHPEQSEGSFTIECADGARYTCRKLIICTGGLSYPKTGSTGDGYGWAKEFGPTDVIHGALARHTFTAPSIAPCRRILMEGEWNEVAGMKVRYFIVPHDATHPSL